MARNDTYTHGHAAAVVNQHAMRTAEDFAAYLLPHLAPGQRLLDVGCGPGTITSGLAKRVAPGEVIGIEVVADVLVSAREHLDAEEVDNVTLEEASVYDLPYEDDSFDIVHAHQVLQHLTAPVDALREMRRVTKPGGLVAIRDADYGTMTHAPHIPMIDAWLELYRRVARANDAEPDAGRFFRTWLLEAGYEEMGFDITTASVSYADEAGVRNWGESWAARTTGSGLATGAIEHGFATREELDAIAAGWHDWVSRPDAFFVYVNGQALARV